MDLLERYLNAVAAQLPKETRDDIVAELRDTLLSQFEAREEALGRALSDDEREEILRAMGHPLVVAARYRKGPQSLIGPELFPYWLFGLKAGLLILLAVHGLSLAIRILGGAEDAGQAIAQAFHGLFGSGLTLIGALTLAGAVFEHYGVRPAYLDRWRVRDLPVLGLSDPANWAAGMAGPAPASAASASWARSVRPGRGWSGGEPAVSIIASTVFLLWWIGVLAFPGWASVELRGEDAVVSAAPIWSVLHGSILAYVVASIGVDLAALLRPGAVRLRAAVGLAVAAGGLWLTWAVFQAGHWFTLTRGQEQARIAGDASMLDFDRLRTLGHGARDLAGMGDTLSVVMVWALAGIALSLGVRMLRDLGRLATGGVTDR